jgi:hypothetical protein
MSRELLTELLWGAACAQLALLLLPVLLYLFTGWKIRREKLLSYLGPAALEVYYSQFPYQANKQKDVSERFRAQFNFLYGRRHFVLPLIIFYGLCLVGVLLTYYSVQSHFFETSNQITLEPTALFALVGGFIWVLNDELRSIARRDVGPKDVHGWSFRILLSIPFGVAVSHVFASVAGDAIAFFMGTFPTQTLFTLGRRIAASKLSLGDDGSEARPELCQLQSVSRANAEAFEDQGIGTIAALAWADPVDLTIRTNFDFNFVLDCMSQALLWVYFQDKTQSLFQYSLRGSQEALALVEAFEGKASPNSEELCEFRQQEVKAAFAEIATKLNMTVDSFVTTLRQVAVDPYTQFIAKVWK